MSWPKATDTLSQEAALVLGLSLELLGIRAGGGVWAHIYGKESDVGGFLGLPSSAVSSSAVF